MTEQTPPPTPIAPGGEPRRERIGRHAHRTRLYLLSALGLAALVYLIALIVANTRHVKVSWVFGSGSTSLVWLVVVPAILGWLLGVATSTWFRRRTRRRR
jgi:uncharacterized integral membrane protein